jgi:hypothetical protein
VIVVTAGGEGMQSVRRMRLSANARHDLQRILKSTEAVDRLELACEFASVGPVGIGSAVAVGNFSLRDHKQNAKRVVAAVDHLNSLLSNGRERLYWEAMLSRVPKRKSAKEKPAHGEGDPWFTMLALLDLLRRSASDITEMVITSGDQLSPREAYGGFMLRSELEDLGIKRQSGEGSRMVKIFDVLLREMGIERDAVAFLKALSKYKLTVHLAQDKKKV